MSREPFWRAPRRLARLLEDGDLTANELGLLAYLALAGADREEGYSTTRAHLEDLLDVSTRTVQRAIAKLRKEELCTFDVVPGQRHPFRVRLTGATCDTTYATHDVGGGVGGVVGDLGHDLFGEEPETRISSGNDLRHHLRHSRARGDRDREEKDLSAAVRLPKDDGGGGDDDVVLEGEVVREPRLEHALQGIVPADGQRARWLEAFLASEEGFAQCVAGSLGPDVRNPAACLDAKIRRGEHLASPNRLPARRFNRGMTAAEVLPQPGDDPGRSVPPASVPALPSGWRPPGSRPLGDCVDCGNAEALVDDLRCESCALRREED
jgi:hypothetical protein